MGTFQNMVKRATKIKMAAPKQKYLKPILMSTGEEQYFKETIGTLLTRLNDSAFTVVFKSLVVMHVMIREGEGNVTLRYLSRHPEYFELGGLLNGSYGSVNSGLQIVRRYGDYLRIRAQEFGKLERDYVREGSSNLKEIGRNMVVLSHVESLEAQIAALIKNRYSQYDLNNDMLMAAFKLLVQDILALYNALNEGIITLLECFFELSRPDAKRTLDLYKRFVHLTETVVKYLKAGKAVGLEIPVIKHITTKLIRSLEDHLREDEMQKNEGQSTSDTANTGSKTSQYKSEAQKQLEIVRQQKRLLQEQLQLTSPLVQQLTQAVPSAPTGYNPFLETTQAPQQQQLVTAQSLIQPQHTHNPFVLQATGFVPQNTAAFITTQNTTTLHHVPQPPHHLVPLHVTPPQQPTPTGSNNPFSLQNFNQQTSNIQVTPVTNPFYGTNFQDLTQSQVPIISYPTGYPQQQQQHQPQPQPGYVNQGPNLIDI
ncbi:uncharacterized protein Ecym_3521 [Eremothecium cymbalariae DBVPG|uniref:ENTH domain-containing protein n=1 Tax=Eremothecium cymbalariae (strain CBS 270.75 / DBVPG 7215 / KCTC 17166 / NRRL Y-17582) TaxID=931890 RepID=G8JQL5_ERECY|nr:Hypothetical protein Ecym_3521 [Eremothecium cymbalariae DBVPG\